MRQKVLAAALRGDRTIRELADSFGVGTTFVDKVLAPHRQGANIVAKFTYGITSLKV